MQQRVAGALLLTFLLGAGPAAAAPVVPSPFVIENAAPGTTFDTPTAIAFTPTGRMLVAEKAGKVWAVKNGVKSTSPLWNRTNEVLNEGDRGLLGLAVDPNYATNRYVYLFYVVDPDSDGIDTWPSDGFGRLVRYQVSAADSNTMDASSRTVLMGVSWRYGPLSASGSHSTGSLRFGSDGSLLVSFGDGASYTDTDAGGLDNTDFGAGPNLTDPYEDIGAFRAQSLTSLCGKVLRINPATGGGYPSNPYWDGNASSPRSRVWGYGFRNPFRFCIRPGGSSDPAQGNPGAVYLGDVGWGTWEELNILGSPGMNFGWPCREGPNAMPNYVAATPAHNGCGSTGTADNPAAYTAPASTWHHTDPAAPGGAGFAGNCSIGGVFYTGTRFPASYRNKYFFADYGQSWLKIATVNASDQLVSIQDFGTNMDGPVDFATDPITGDIYYVAIVTGEVRRLRYASVAGNTNPVAVANGTPTFGTAPLAVTFSSAGTFDADADLVTVSWLFGDGTGSSSASPIHTYLSPGIYDAVLTADDGRGGIGRDTVRVIASSSVTFPSTAVLDNFNRANGAIGGNWTDATADFAINSNALAPLGGTSYLEWNGAVFGPNQEVFVTLAAISPDAPEHNLSLKVQGTSWSSGHIEVSYDSRASRVIVATLTPPDIWTTVATFSGITLAPGNQFGARALQDGTVQVYGNGVALGTCSVAAWPSFANGGRIGLSCVDAGLTRFDNFGGGDAALGLNTPPVATIISPADHAYYADNDTIQLKGTGSDAEDAPSALGYHWEVALHHNNHVHPNIFSSDAQNDYIITQNHDDGTGVFMEIRLFVTDTHGTRDTAIVNIYPEVDLTPDPPVLLPAIPHAGSPVTASVWLRNTGGMPSPAMHWQMLVDGSLAAAGDTLVPALDGVLIQRTLTPGYALGTHQLRFVVDSLNAFVETNEANNGATLTFSTTNQVAAVEGAPRELALSAPNPNPTAASTILRLALPAPERVELSVFDPQGREVWSEPARRYEAGAWTLRWPGTDHDGRRSRPGVYLVQVRAGRALFNRRVALVR